jgi:hypothetical protein
VADDDSKASIEVRVERTSQLFDTLDPFPVPQRDLARNIEDYVVGWARELSRRQTIEIVVHLPAAEATRLNAGQLSAAFSNFFRERADRSALDLKELFRVGRWSLIIGMAVLASCLVLARFLQSRFGQGFLGQFSNEGLIVLGWVANWRPMEIFLYDWWPLVRRQNLYRRLSAAAVILKPF